MIEIMPILTNVVPLILIGVIALIVIINVITGLIGGLKKRIAALIAIIISAIIAAIVTSLVCSPTSELVTFLMEQIGGLLGGEEGAVSILEEGSMAEAIVYYIAMAVKPVFFTAVYGVLSFILCIVASIVSKFIPVLNKISGVAKRLGGAGVGVVTGLLVSLFVLVPVVGTLMVGADVVDNFGIIEALSETEGEESAQEELDAEKETESLAQAYSGFKYLGYELLYDGLANENYYGEKVYLRKDVHTLVTLIDELGDVGSDFSSMDEEKISGINSALDTLEELPLIRGIISGIVSDAAESWSNGEVYLGLEKISAGEVIDPLIDTALDILATTDKDVIVSDIRTVVNTFGVLAEHGLLDESEEGGDMLDKISDGTIISDMLEVIGENERMYPLADEVTRLGLRTLATTLGIPNDADERYDALMDELAAVMNDTYGMSEDERYDAVANGLKTALGDYGVEVGGEALESVTEGILSDFGGESSVESTDVKEFFMLYAAASAADSSASAGGGLVNLSTSQSNGVTVNSDGTINVNGVTLQHYTAYNYRYSASYSLGLSGVSFDDAAMLYSAESMKSSFVTLEEILNLLGEYGECEDVAAEADKIGSIFGEFLSMVARDEFNETNAKELFEKVGGVLDEMKTSEIFGSEVTGKLLSAIMQSDVFVENLGLSRADLTHMADTINSHALETEGGFADATGAVASTVDAVNTATKEDATKEDKVQSVEAMIDKVTVENAEMLTTVLTGNIVNEMNSNVENSDTVSNSLGDLINNMAQFKENDPTDEQISAEAEAVTQVLSLAMTGANDGAIFNSGDTKGSVDATPEEFIGQMVNSEVVMQTITTTAEGSEENPYGVKYSNEKESENVSKALESYYVENGGGEELAQKLQNLAIVMNVEIDLGE